MTPFAFAGLLTMTTLAFAPPLDAATMTAPTIEIDGSAARALALASATFAEKLPDARLEDYIVHLDPPAEGSIRVVFEPRQAPGAPTLGGRTAAGRELNVWVKTADYSVDRLSFAR